LLGVVVPPGVVTVTCTIPLPPGLTAVICVSLFTVKVLVAVPNSTSVAPVKPLPRIVTVVPPVAGPDVGEMPDTTGTPGDTGPLVTAKTALTDAPPPFELKLILAEYRPAVSSAVSAITLMVCDPPAGILP